MDLKLEIGLSEEFATSFTISKANGLLSSFIGTSDGNILKVSY